MWVQSLGREDPLEEEMATHSSTLAWRIPWTEERGGLWPHGPTSEWDTTEATWHAPTTSKQKYAVSELSGGTFFKKYTFQHRGSGLIPSQGTKIPQASGQLNSCTTTREACTLQQRPSTNKKKKYSFAHQFSSSSALFLSNRIIHFISMPLYHVLHALNFWWISYQEDKILGFFRGSNVSFPL